MKAVFFSLLLGYLLGTLNPAALLSKIKGQDLRQLGTKNLGASNAFLTIGKLWGLVVMAFDVAKGVLSVLLAEALFPTYGNAGLLAGSGSVVGHIYPFYLHFKGGKGLAAFSGMVLGYDPAVFLILLVIGCLCMLLFNYGIALTLSGAALFPLLSWYRSGSLSVFLLSLAAALLIILKHLGVLKRVLQGDEVKIRSYIKEQLFH